MRYLKTILTDIIDLYQKIDKVRTSDTIELNSILYKKFDVHQKTILDLVEEAKNYIGRVVRIEAETTYGGMFIAVAKVKGITDYGIALEGVRIGYDHLGRSINKIHYLKCFHNIKRLQCEYVSQAYLDDLLHELKVSSKVKSNIEPKIESIPLSGLDQLKSQSNGSRKKNGWIRIN